MKSGNMYTFRHFGIQFKIRSIYLLILVYCLIMNLNSMFVDYTAEVPSLLASKIGMKHAGVDLEAMAAIAKVNL